MTIAETWKQIQLLYGALLAGQLLFGLVVIYLLNAVLPEAAATTGMQYPLLALSVVVLALVAARYFNKLRSSQARDLSLPLGGKVLHYRTTILMRSAIMEAGNFICLTLVILTQSYYPMLFFGIGIVAFTLLRPSPDDMIVSYNLTMQEATELRNSLQV